MTKEVEILRRANKNMIDKCVDEKVDSTRCGGLGNCHDDERCLTHDLWVDLSDQIYQFLDNISLGTKEILHISIEFV